MRQRVPGNCGQPGMQRQAALRALAEQLFLGEPCRLCGFRKREVSSSLKKWRAKAETFNVHSFDTAQGQKPLTPVSHGSSSDRLGNGRRTRACRDVNFTFADEPA